MVFDDSFFSESFVLFTTLFFLLICYYLHQFFYFWKQHKVPTLQVEFQSFNKQHLGIKFKLLYNEMKKRKLKFGGINMQLSHYLIIADLTTIKNIMTKDFDFFPHRGLYYNENDPLSCHIFNISGSKWKRMRTKLNPIFTAKNLQSVFQFFQNCNKNLILDVELKINEGIDVKKLIDNFINNIIESCVFGLDCKNFENKSLFQNLGEKIFERSKTRKIKGFIVDNFPLLGMFFNIALIPKEASTFFLKVIEDAVEFRTSNKIVRQDFLQVLLSQDNEDGDVLTTEEIAAQCFIFYLAGMSTSPTAITFALYELAKNKNIQNQLRTEIGSVLQKYNNQICYNAIQEMTYLDQVFDETLRKYPPAAYLNRKCTKNYKIDSDVVLKRGTTIITPVLGIHHDENFYPNSDVFDPGRFTKENKILRPNYSFLPYGKGSRICIGTVLSKIILQRINQCFEGQRFGEMQSKFAIVSLINEFKISVNEKTQEPLKMKKEPLVLTADGGIWLNFTKI